MRVAASVRTRPARSSTSSACRSARAQRSRSRQRCRPTDSDQKNRKRKVTTNQQIHLVSRPSGEATVDNFKLVQAEVPALKDGEVLVRHHFMSLDPYMRGRMNDAKSYAAPQPLNMVMQGGTVGEIVASKNADYAVGQKVVGFGGWQD